MRLAIAFLCCLFACSLSTEVVAQNNCYEVIASYSGHESLIDDAAIEGAACELQSLVADKGAIEPLRVVGIDLYPLSFFQNKRLGYAYAYTGILAQVRQAGPHLAFFIKHEDQGRKTSRVHVSLPGGGEMDGIGAFEVQALENLLDVFMDSLLTERDPASAIATTIQEASRLIREGIVSMRSMEDAGFVAMLNPEAVYPNLTTTTTPYVADHQGIYDHSYCKVGGQSIGQLAL